MGCSAVHALGLWRRAIGREVIALSATDTPTGIRALRGPMSKVVAPVAPRGTSHCKDDRILSAYECDGGHRDVGEFELDSVR